MKLSDHEKELFWIGLGVMAFPFLVAWVGLAYSQAVLNGGF